MNAAEKDDITATRKRNVEDDIQGQNRRINVKGKSKYKNGTN